MNLRSISASFVPSTAIHRRPINPFLGPAVAPAPSSSSEGTSLCSLLNSLSLLFFVFCYFSNSPHLGPVAGPSSKTSPRHHRHREITRAISPSPSTGSGNIWVSLMNYLVTARSLSCSLVTCLSLSVNFGVLAL